MANGMGNLGMRPLQLHDKHPPRLQVFLHMTTARVAEHSVPARVLVTACQTGATVCVFVCVSWALVLIIQCVRLFMRASAIS